jgi:linoleate 10R-lipoxygenase
MLTKLFYRTLPDYFPRGSAYAHFPLMVPSKMKQYAAKNDPTNVDKYTWTRPQPTKGVVPIKSYRGVETVLERKDVFSSSIDERVGILTKGVKRDSDTVRL